MQKLQHLPFYFFTLLLGLLFLYATTFIPMAQAEKVAPGSSLYGYPVKFLKDYFLYTYLIKSGQEGHLFFRNPYSEEHFPPLIAQVHYPVWGMITRPLHISPFDAYFLAKLIAYGFLIISVYIVIDHAFKRQSSKILAFILFLSATSVWSYAAPTIYGQLVEPQTYSNWFNVFLKLTMLPPHHIIAVILLMLLIVRVSQNKQTLRSFLISGILGFILANLHPYVANTLLFILMAHLGLDLVVKRRFERSLFFHCLSIACGVIPVSAYYGWTLIAIYQEANQIHGTLVAVPPVVSFQNYLLALGPLVFISSIALLLPSTWKSPRRRLLVLWAYLPILLFYLPTIVPIPTGEIRLFQVYQHIPLALLGVVSVDFLLGRLERIRFLVLPALATASMLYAVEPYRLQYEWHISPFQPYFAQYQILKDGRNAFSYLDKTSQVNSVIVAPEMASILIPTFTHNHVILGQDNRHYDEKKAEIDAFYGGLVPLGSLQQFLAKYHASYVIFGLASNSFEASPYKESRLLVPVYRQGNVTIAKAIQ